MNPEQFQAYLRQCPVLTNEILSSVSERDMDDAERAQFVDFIENLRQAAETQAIGQAALELANTQLMLTLLQRNDESEESGTAHEDTERSLAMM